MSKLIGTNPNQVPSNADLGTAAFMDKKEFLLSKGSDISAIDAVIPKTAVDVFIYDTSKDSDGGAWRKRTQHTSWYKERLNTTTRGSRKEFPSVAVIVAESNQVTIYDGDDPDLPMWMVFNTGGNWNHILVSTSGYVRCVAMLNGNLVIGRNLNTGWMLTKTSFVDDSSYGYKNAAHGTSDGVWTGGIVARNGDGSYYDNGVASNIISQYNNDVAMTVLPNAPIDAATGLPVPTIAVATNGGISVIKDNSTVVSTASSIYVVGSIQILPTGEIYHSQGYNGNNGFCYNDNFERLSGMDVGTYANSSTFWYAIDGIGNDSSLLGGGLADENAVGEGLDTAVGTASGLTTIALNSSSLNDGMVAWRTSNYNTGWMPGDVKLATLSDTDVADVSDTELVTNADLSSSTGWNIYGEAVFSSGNVTFSSAATAYTGIIQPISLTAGKVYRVELTVTNPDSWSFGFAFQTSTTGVGVDPDAWSNYLTGTGTFVRYFTAKSSHNAVVFHLGPFPGTTITFNDVSVTVAEEDRSVNGNGLQVFGSITKNPVATGADLVSYSGFSSSARLQQPYTSAMDFGTGDICINLWAKHIHNGSSLAYYFFDKADTDGTNRCGAYYIPNSGVLDFYTPSGTSRANNVSINDWSMITFVRTGTMSYVYINGEVRGTQTGVSENLTSSDQTGMFTIGARFNGAEPWTVGDLSLVRVSATAPSPEQIKKMYEDEKFLFQENAKATLYGSSDAVTALAYDDVTQTLHVGTSDGRSDFQGLRRVNNTTRAVGTAISAVDGFVVEE